MSKHSIWKKLALSLTAFVVCVLFAELAARWLFPAPDFLRIDLLSYGAEYQLSPNRKLIYLPKPHAGENNSYGHRGPVFPLERGNRPRVMFIGDSVVEGFGVAQDDRFTHTLDQALGDRVEVVNLAVRGYNLRQEIEYFKTFGRRFSPDVVLVGITYNDLHLHSGEVANLDRVMKSSRRGAFYQRYYSARKGAETWLMRSHLYRYLTYLLTMRKSDGFRQEVGYKLDADETRELVQELEALSVEDDFGLCFVFLPVNTDIAEDDMAFLRRLAREEEIEAVDLEAMINERMDQEAKSKLFRPNDPCHLSRLGHRETAALLHPEIDRILRDRKPIARTK